MKKWTGVLVFVLLLSGQNLFAQQWGSIKGRIVVQGEVLKLVDLVKKGDSTVKNPLICAANAIPDDSVVVGKKGGLANCFVYIYQRRGTPDIHPLLKKPAQAKLKFDNKGCRFVPHAMVVRSDQVVNCVNSDGCGHNVHTFPLRNNGINQLIAANDQIGINVEFAKGEPLPMQITCDIHPWMTAKWFVVDHPYAVMTDEKGNFEIKLIPPGKHKFRFWHEKPGYIKQKGKRDIELEIVNNKVIDLGDIKVPAGDLK